MQGKYARVTNVVLGAWLLISSFAWKRGTPNFVNAWVIGLLVIASSLVALRSPRFRFVSTAAGFWLIASLFAWPDYSSPLVWNNVMVGLGIVVVSLVGPREAAFLG